MSIVKKLFKACKHSKEGLIYAIENEFACRLEIFLLAILGPLAFFVGQNKGEVILLLASLVFIFIIELINTAIEAVVDRISIEQHPLSKAAKDVGSAAVFVSSLLAFLIWGVVLFY